MIHKAKKKKMKKNWIMSYHQGWATDKTYADKINDVLYKTVE